MVASFDCRSPYDPAAYAAAALEERLEETRVVYANVFFGVGVGAAARGGTKDAKGSAGIAGLGWVLEATRWRSAGVAEVHASGCADGPHAAAGGEGKTCWRGRGRDPGENMK